MKNLLWKLICLIKLQVLLIKLFMTKLLYFLTKFLVWKLQLLQKVHDFRLMILDIKVSDFTEILMITKSTELDVIPMITISMELDQVIRITQSTRLVNEVSVTASQDRAFCNFMDIHSISQNIIIATLNNMIPLFFKVKMLYTDQSPFAYNSKKPIEYTTANDLYDLINKYMLTPNYNKSMSNSYWILIFNGQVLQWSTIISSLVLYYRSNNITINMLPTEYNYYHSCPVYEHYQSNPIDIPTIYLICSTINDSTVFDTSTLDSVINKDALLSFNNIRCVEWTKNCKFHWYITTSYVIDSNIQVDSSLRYHLDKISQINPIYCVYDDELEEHDIYVDELES